MSTPFPHRQEYGCESQKVLSAFLQKMVVAFRSGGIRVRSQSHRWGRSREYLKVVFRLETDNRVCVLLSASNSFSDKERNWFDYRLTIFYPDAIIVDDCAVSVPSANWRKIIEQGKEWEGANLPCWVAYLFDELRKTMTPKTMDWGAGFYREVLQLREGEDKQLAELLRARLL